MRHTKPFRFCAGFFSAPGSAALCERFGFSYFSVFPKDVETIAPFANRLAGK